MQKIIPHLWFDTEAKEAATFYCEIFPNSKLLDTITLKDTPGGDSDVVTFNLNGYDFMAISAGPFFKINSSISFLLNFDPATDNEAEGHLRALWQSLSAEGIIRMPLQQYPYSKLYGWVQDRYGVNWQLMLTNPSGEPRPFIIPTCVFAGENVNKAEEAVKYYLSVFKNTKEGTVARYLEDTGPAKKDSIMFTDFMLENQWFAAMDSGTEQSTTFNEAVSFLVNCDTQEEIDYYWEQLSVVPEAEQCGWLKDKYGISWQVSPSGMSEMLHKGTPEQTARVTQAFLKMKKIDIAQLDAAYRGPETQ